MIPLAPTDIGYGLRPDNPLEMAATGAANAGDMEPIDFDAFAALWGATLLRYSLRLRPAAVRVGRAPDSQTAWILFRGRA